MLLAGSTPFHVLRASVYDHGPGASWVSARRPHYNLWIALEGEALFERAGRTWPVAGGSALLLVPEEPVRWRAGPRSRLVNFAAHLSGDAAFADAVAGVAAVAAPTPLPALTWLPGLCRYLSRGAYPGGELQRAELVEGVSLLLLSLQRAQQELPLDARSGRLLEVVESIRQDPTPIRTAPGLARKCGLSTSQFTRRFRALTGCSPARFIIEERLRRADALLAETPWTLQAIAEACGYRDVYFFSRQYRRYRGVPPSTRRGSGSG